MRLFLLRFHLIVGLIAGLVLLVMGATGMILSLEPRVIDYLGRHQTTVPTPPSEADREEQRLPLNTLAEKAKEAFERTPNGLTLSNDPGAAVAFTLGQERTLWLNPYTGESLGESPKKAQEFFKWVEGLHRWLALEGKSRTTGRYVTLAATACYFLLLVSGLFMWDRRFLKDKSNPRRWHKEFGFILSPLILVSIVTGLLIAINALTFKGPPGGGQGMRGGGGGGQRPAIDFDAVVAAAAEKAPGWKKITIRAPRGRGASELNVGVEEGKSWFFHTSSRLTLPLPYDPAAGNAKWEPFESMPLWPKILTWGRILHEGLYAGWLGTLAVLAVGVATVTLVVTGFVLAWKRLRPSKNGKAAVASPSA